LTLRLATWNVNSVRQRLKHLARFCTTAAPDVLCLQETKVQDADFPARDLRDLGYVHQVVHGQKGYNGVAILSRVPFEAEGTEVWCGRDDRRHAFVRLPDGIELHNFYVPSGGPVPDPERNEKFAHKLQFLTEMARWGRRGRAGGRRLVLMGDLNVAPLETDVWNHRKLLRSVGHTPVESEHLQRVLGDSGLIDAARHFVPPGEHLYTWWGYRFPRSLEKNYGWRLDHIWVSAPLLPALHGFRVVKETRTWERPSDHVPVVIEVG
jgi:exodeoxyribonuclease-3